MPFRPQKHQCIIPNCGSPGRNQLGVRCRVAHGDGPTIAGKRRTDAIFSIESAAYLCDEHALAGLAMKLAILPEASGEASIDVICGRSRVDKRITRIARPPADETRPTTNGGQP
jgi:hypothetical protein